MGTQTTVPLEDIDLSSIEFWLAGSDYREAAFATLRQAAPVRFFEEAEFPWFPKGPGYWALTRYDDIVEASRRPDVFCSGHGTNITDLPQQISEFFGSMINMDDPKHARLRGIVQKGFTPRMVAQVDQYVRDKAKVLVDDAIERHPDGVCDFVETFAAPLPLQIICEMMGIPREDESRIFAWTNVILGAGDPDYGGSFESLMASSLEMYEYAQALGEDRRQNPRDDITSALMQAELDGERLTGSEFGSFFILLVVAGNETTRNAISHGMKALTDFADQRRLWWEDFHAGTRNAVEEIVRWATPVISFRRTATADTEIRGVPIKEGEKVVFWFNSGNRDEEHFEAPHTFNVRRYPNNHLAFGAGGPHFCLGASLARREIAVMFEEIWRRMPNLEVTRPPAMLQSNFIHGIKTMPCAWK
ncbi:MAG TPA: cytochrome P450 [Candidatus Dormibacteraeota bacterium]|nr:cytochrome P450 [Candidatus Dormibacteraeota bacterium]